MLKSLAALLPASLRAVQGTYQLHSVRAMSGAVNLKDPVMLKRFVGLEDALGVEPNARDKLSSLLHELLSTVQALPASAGYRQALEATCNYRLKVLEANESNQAVEEVLDAHMEELILECKEELNILPIMADTKPWNVSADHVVPVFDYHDASEFLNAKK